jgi:cytochrome c2
LADDSIYRRGQPRALTAVKGEEDLVWNDEKLSAYLERHKDVVPKGKTEFPGLKNEADRADAIA